MHMYICRHFVSMQVWLQRHYRLHFLWAGFHAAAWRSWSARLVVVWGEPRAWLSSPADTVGPRATVGTVWDVVAWSKHRPSIAVHAAVAPCHDVDTTSSSVRVVLVDMRVRADGGDSVAVSRIRVVSRVIAVLTVAFDRRWRDHELVAEVQTTSVASLSWMRTVVKQWLFWQKHILLSLFSAVFVVSYLCDVDGLYSLRACIISLVPLLSHKLQCLICSGHLVAGEPLLKVCRVKLMVARWDWSWRLLYWYVHHLLPQWSLLCIARSSALIF